MKTSILVGLFLVGSTLNGYAQSKKEKKKILFGDVEMVYAVSDKNEKSGPVVIKDSKTDKVFMKGTNTGDKPSGKWYFYNENGNLESYYNYDEKKLLYIDSAYLNKIQVTIKSQDKEAITKASIPILLYPSTLFVKEITGDIFIPDTEFDGRTEIPLKVSAIIKPNGHVNYFASYMSGKKQVNIPITPKNREFASLFIPAQYNGKSVESVFTMNTVAVNDGSNLGHRRFMWNY